MQRSVLISLIAAAVVLIGGAATYVVLQEPASQQETQADTEAGGSQASGSEAGSTQTAGSEAAQDGSSSTSGGSATQSADATTESAAQPESGTQAEQSGGSTQDAAGQQQASAPATSAESQEGDDRGASQSASGSTGQSAAQTEAPESAAPVTPSFDVVRVEPSGDTVIAGRAEAGSKVTILDNGKPLGSVTADGRGEWVFVSEKPLEPGSRELSLEAEDGTGLKIPSEDVVVMTVPEKRQADAGSDQESAAQAGTSQDDGTQDTAAQDETPIAVLTPREGSGGSQILQAPQGEGIAEGDLVMEAVDYGAGGKVTISGRAAPGSAIRLYLDNELLGETSPNEQGRWSYSLAEDLPFGIYQLRADQVNESGEVLARVETPFSRVEFARAELPDEKFVIVQPGNSLWRIARGTLGEGVRYSVIYEANQDQIRDPDLIYPGQIFMVPQADEVQTN